MHPVTRFDTTALNKALIGFDSLFNNFERRFATQISSNYPVYNIIKHNEDTYEIQVAVSGFDPSEITVEIDQSELTITAQRTEEAAEIGEYLYRGLAARSFTRKFPLAEYIEVGEGQIKNGILSVELKRVIPEALKPRLINIKSV
jgi:molecular chaperone IbpA